MVNDNIKMAVLGGDRRQIYALANLARKDFRISVIGLPREAVFEVCEGDFTFENDLEAAISGASVILLPFPTSTDGVRINCPLDRSGALSEVKLSTLVRLADVGATVIGGKMPPAFAALAEARGLRVCDLLSLEAFEIKNAYITAEAALSIAMNSLSKNVCSSHVAVTGFGRIAKQLSRLLASLGAHVTVAARKESDLAYAGTLGYSCLKIEGERWSDSLQSGCDVIFNTVPHTIFDREFLIAVDKKTLLIELASVPGGFDISAAQELGSNVSWALSLPGKYAPESAGEIIAECVMRLVGEV